MDTIFQALRHKPFANHLGLTPSRFSQKMNKAVVNGYKMDFTDDEKLKIKEFALFITESMLLEIGKI